MILPVLEPELSVILPVLVPDPQVVVLTAPAEPAC
jgi:hypothetical protein